MSPKTEHFLFVSLLLVALTAIAMLFLGNADLLGNETTTEFILKVMLYPAVLGFLVLTWRKIDRKINNDKAKNVDEL